MRVVFSAKVVRGAAASGAWERNTVQFPRCSSHRKDIYFVSIIGKVRLSESPSQKKDTRKQRMSDIVDLCDLLRLRMVSAKFVGSLCGGRGYGSDGKRCKAPRAVVSRSVFGKSLLHKGDRVVRTFYNRRNEQRQYFLEGSGSFFVQQGRGNSY